MAGFAVFMTIATYGLIGLVVASLLSVCFALVARQRLLSDSPNRRKIIATSAVSPFLALAWLVAALLIHVQISNRLAHQDCGLSPDPYVTLPNGYILGSANTYDGYIKAPGAETDVPVEGPGYVRSLIDVQLIDGYFIGTQFDLKTSEVRHFVYDTRTRAFQASDTKESASRQFQASNPNDVAAWSAAQTSVHTDANSYWVLYSQYRHRWPNYVLLALILAGECATAVWVWKTWATGKFQGPDSSRENDLSITA
jgi:hypothetical protein